VDSKQYLHRDELYFTINQVAKEIGVVPATIRNWEKQRLFTAKRTKNGYRIYSMGDIEKLRNFKQYSKDERMGINAIRMLYGTEEESGLPQKETRGAVEVSKKLLSQKWRECRLSRGYLLEEVAQAIGISAFYLSKIENVQANVSYDILQKRAEFYGENILYYVENTDE